MSSYSNRVIIHQNTTPSISSRYTASSGSYPSSNSSSTPRSMSPTDEEFLRVYGANGASGATKHQASTKGSKNVTVFNSRQGGYEHGAPTPSYDAAGGYGRH